MSRMVWAGASWSGRERNCAFLNLDGRRFVDASSVLGLDFQDDARAVAVTDWDGDGDVDLWIKNRTSPQLRFMQNNGADGGFVSFQLEGTSSNRDAVGARVLIESGGRPHVQTVTAGSGYLSQSSKRVLVGLGRSDRIDRCVVRWPGGRAEELHVPHVNSHYRYTEGSGALEIDKASGGSSFTRVSDARRPADGPSHSKDALPPEGSSQIGYLDRIVMRQPVPLPADFVGAAAAHGEVTLATFWSLTCPACLVELHHLGENLDRLRAARVRVRPLCLDDDASRRKVERILADVKLASHGVFLGGPRQTLLSVLLASILDIRDTTPLPLSFLMDAEDRLRIVYTAEVPINDLLQDVRSMTAAGDRGDVPPRFAGKWFATPVRRYNDMVDELKRAKLLEWARFYLRLDRAAVSR